MIFSLNRKKSNKTVKKVKEKDQTERDGNTHKKSQAE